MEKNEQVPKKGEQKILQDYVRIGKWGEGSGWICEGKEGEGSGWVSGGKGRFRLATEWLCRRQNDAIGDGMGKSATVWWYWRRFGAHRRWFGAYQRRLGSLYRHRLGYDILGADGWNKIGMHIHIYIYIYLFIYLYLYRQVFSDELFLSLMAAFCCKRYKGFNVFSDERKFRH